MGKCYRIGHVIKTGALSIISPIKAVVELYGFIQRNVAQLECSCKHEMWKMTRSEPGNEAENLRSLSNELVSQEGIN